MDKPLKLHNMNHLTIIIELTSTLHKKLEIWFLDKLSLGYCFLWEVVIFCYQIGAMDLPKCHLRFDTRSM
jgi:hypothetical protein